MLVCTFSAWIEAFLTTKGTAETVTRILLQNIIPWFGLSQSIQSDNGLAFIPQITQQASMSLNVTWHLYIPYHPQSSKKVEKANRLIKSYFTKLILELHQPLPELLPLALTRLRTLPTEPNLLSPFEFIYRRPFFFTLYSILCKSFSSGWLYPNYLLSLTPAVPTCWSMSSPTFRG